MRILAAEIEILEIGAAADGPHVRRLGVDVAGADQPVSIFAEFRTILQIDGIDRAGGAVDATAGEGMRIVAAQADVRNSIRPHAVGGVTEDLRLLVAARTRSRAAAVAGRRFRL